MNSPRAWWHLPADEEEAKASEPGTPARSVCRTGSDATEEGLCAEGLWQSMRQASSTMRSTDKSRPKRFQQVLNQWIRRTPDHDRLRRLAKPVQRRSQDVSLEFALVHPNRTFDATRLVELAMPKQERKPTPLAPQLRRRLNLNRLKELAEPQMRRRPEKTAEISSRVSTAAFKV
eukprot:symbB.v1.2.020851.t1/scaffold1711.1/size185425/14